MMKVLEEQGEEMRGTDDNQTERETDAKLRLDLQRAVERATLQLESRALRNEDGETCDHEDEVECVSDLPN